MLIISITNMKTQLIFCIVVTITLIVYLRKKKMDLFEHLVDFSTSLAQDSVSTFNDFEDMGGVTEELLQQLMSSQKELEKMMEHSKNDKVNTFSSSNVKNNVQSIKNSIELSKTDEQLKQIQQIIENLNDANPSISEMKAEFSK